MKSKPIFLLALVLGCGVFGCSTAREQPHRYITRFKDGELPEVEWFEKPSAEELQNIKVARISLPKDELAKLAALPKDPQNGAKWLVEVDPDTLHDGPWKTDLYIFGNTDTNRCVQIELKDHTSGGVRYSWLNAKNLFVEVWWGHIAYTDFILDTKTLKFLSLEDGYCYFDPTP